MEKEERPSTENKNLKAITNADGSKTTENAQIPIETEQEKLKSILISESKTMRFAGPLPPPEILQQYNEILPGAAERVFSLTEKQAAHRMNLENSIVQAQIRESSRGQTFALIIAVLGLGSAAFLGFHDKTTIASIFAGSTVLGLVTAFILGKKSQQKITGEK